MILLAALLLPIEQAPIAVDDPIDQRAINAIRGRASAGISGDPRPAVQARSRAERAKARSVLRVLVRRGLAEGGGLDEALCEDVADGDFSAHMRSIEDLDNSLYSGEALQAWAVALDLAGDLSCRAELAAGVEALAADLDAGFNDRLSLILRGYNQNHRLKVFAALAAARLALDQSPTGPAMAPILGELVRISHANAHSFGGYGEGPSYWSYQAKQSLPVFLALGLSDPSCTEVPEHFMPWTCRVVHESWRWAGRMRVPAETVHFAHFDDSTPGAWFNFAMIPDPEALALGQLAGGFDSVWAPEVLAWRWRGEPSELPAQRLIDDYAAGQLGLADDGRRELLMMQAEYGLSAGEGRDQNGDEIQGTAGHNQTAPLSLMWHRGDRWRLIDPGYLGWSSRRPVASAEHHSMPLIDGRGPTGPVPHVPRLIDDGSGGLVPEDPDEEGGYILTPGGRAYGEVVSNGLTNLAPWTMVVARRDGDGAEDGPVLRRLLLHHPDGHLIVVDQLRAPSAGGMTLHFQLPETLEGSVAEWRVPASDGDRAFTIRSTQFVGEAAVALEGTRRARIHDAWHWREAPHAQLAFTVEGSNAMVVTSIIDEVADGPTIAWTEGGLQIGTLPLLRFEGSAELAGWSFGEARFALGTGLSDSQAGIEPIPSTIRKLSEADDQGVPFARSLTASETPSRSFLPSPEPGNSGATWTLLIPQAHQAPAETFYRRAPPMPEPAPAEGCGCAGSIGTSLWLLVLLLRRRRRIQRTRN